MSRICNEENVENIHIYMKKGGKDYTLYKWKEYLLIYVGCRGVTQGVLKELQVVLSKHLMLDRMQHWREGKSFIHRECLGCTIPVKEVQMLYTNIKEIDLSPAELKAIEDHKYFMSQKQGQEVSIEDAIRDFVNHYKDTWIKEKQKQENYEQIEEIKRFMHTKSQETGCEISENDAAEEWMDMYAHIWRQEKESLEKNGFLTTEVVVQNEKGLHMRPSSTLATLTSKFDCDVYVHKDGMEHYNLILNGRKYMNVKSVLGILTLAACKGEALEFIATGRQAVEAIKAIEVFVNNGCKTCA